MKKSDCYFGIYPIRFVWRSVWDDPKLMYKGHTFNLFDVEGRLFEMYMEENSAPCFENWVKANGKRVKEYLNYRIELSKFDR